MKKVVIIGAGPAGVTAGLELLRKSKDYEVIILEESNYIGGISRTINYKGNRMDIGGHRFFSKNKRVMDFWFELLPLQHKPSYDDKKLHRKKKLAKIGPDPQKDNKVFLLRQRISRIYYLNKFFDYPISLKWETFKNLGIIRTISSGFSYLKSMLIKRKEDNLENFYINRFGKKLYSMFFKNYTKKVWGRDPSNISADWGSQRVKGLSIKTLLSDTFKKIFHIENKNKETSLIEEFYYPKYGPGQLWETAAKEFTKLGGRVLKNHKVVKINKEGNKITNVLALVDDELVCFDCDILISSMPIKDLFSSFSFKVPNTIKDIALNLPYRDFVTIGLLVKKLDLENHTNIKTINNIVPDCWIYVQDDSVKLGRIQIFNNWSPYLVKDINKTVWIGLEYFCNENDEFWNMSNKSAINYAIDELVSMGIIKKEYVITSHREKVKKAYPAYFDSYKDIDKVIDYLNNIDNLYCIGRNGQHHYNNMDHSMISAFEAVNNILNNIKTKDNVWNVNVEKEYHEE